MGPELAGPLSERYTYTYIQA